MDRRLFSSLFLAGVVVAAIGPALAKPKVKLLFVHGRGQEGLRPDELKAGWLAALSRGAAAVGGSLPPSLDVAFPFYGDILETFVTRANLPLTPDIHAHGGTGQDDEFLAFQAEVAQSIRERSGVTDEEILREYGDNPKSHGPLNWEWVQAILIAIDKHGGGLSSSAIERFTRDVYLYTTRVDVQQEIDALVRADLSIDPTVVVGHSLGSVVAYNVLRHEARAVQIPLFLTVGSPLAIRAVRDKLVPLAFPKNVSSWYNAYDPRDVVALYPLDHGNFPLTPPITNFGEVQNHTENRHGIDGYLDDKHVARMLLGTLPS